VRIFALTFVLASAALSGCSPQIGDDCLTSLDCSQQGDRLCDTSQPEGYCTVFDCQPDACPGASVCVQFGSEFDPACSDDGPIDPRWKRFERSFCLAACELDEDCRDGYRCLPPADRRGNSVDLQSEFRGSKVCFPSSETPSDSDAVAPAVCEPVASDSSNGT
jgi:hypothetical protein